MSFFVRKAPKIKNKKKGNIEKREKKRPVADEVSSDSEIDLANDVQFRKRRTDNIESDSDEETAQEKKVRLAKKYLEAIEREEKEKAENDFVDDSAVDKRLKDEVLEKSGNLFKNVADSYLEANIDDCRILKNGHKLSVTCVCVSSNLQFVYSGSKDCSIVQWCFNTGKKLKVILGGKNAKDNVGHKSCVNCLALSSDDKFLASGCQTNVINIWDAKILEPLKTLTGHRGSVTGLAFRKGFHMLYSCAADKSVKVWNIDEMVYVETLFGHENVITGIDSLTRERAITSGGTDGTIRIWKIVEESQLVFQGHTGSIDCIKLIDEQHFISGAQDGSLSLWNIAKKRPVSKISNAHGCTEAAANWIVSLASMVNTDLFVSGSYNGSICFWKCCDDFKKIESMFTVAVEGFINGLQLTSDGKHLIVAVGQEHRLGRWWTNKQAKNCILVIPLLRKLDNESIE